MKSTSTFRSILCVAGGSLLAATLPSRAVPISIPNANFDLRNDPFPNGNPPADGARVNFLYAVESWRHFRATTNGGPVRLWNPGAPGNTNLNFGYGFGGDAPSNNHVAVVFNRFADDDSIGSVTGFPGARDFEAAVQLLQATFDPAATYTLTAKVGRLPNLAEGGSSNRLWSYAVQLAVGGTEGNNSGISSGWVEGGTVIAQDNNTLAVAADTFMTSTVTFTPDPGNAALTALAGQRLQIRLCVLQDPTRTPSTTYVAFDDVALDVILPPTAPFIAEITPAVNPATGYDIRWSSRTGKIYTVFTSTTLDTPVETWTVAAANIAPTPPQNSFNVPADGPRGFYVVKEAPAP